MSDKEKAKGFLHAPNPWVVTIVGIVLTPIVTGSIDFFQDRDIFHTFLSIVTWIWEKIVWFMLMDVKVIHVVAVLAIIGIVWLIREWLESQIDLPNSTVRPDFLSYTEDRFKGNLKWSWKYGYNTTREYLEIEELTPHCSKDKCDIPLIMTGEAGQCPICDELYFPLYPTSYPPSPSGYEIPTTFIEESQKVRAVIIDNIKKGNFPEKDQGEKL